LLVFISQSELARLLSVHHSIIGKYERDEVKPSIDVVKNIAAALDTTVGYLLGE
jgi:transcriptional regulator with XRE-family HTH domain